jgi:putative hydrolase of the HAD superfamily
MPSGRIASRLDAVTVDAMGTSVDLDDPAPRLQHALAERGVQRELEEVAAAFRAEVAYYLPRTLEGRDEKSLDALACVSNWDISLHSHLEEARLDGYFAEIVSSAEAGAAKPDPEVFRLALERLGVTPERAVHVGDGDTDREGAAAAGIAFEPPPIATLPERLGLGRRP